MPHAVVICYQFNDSNHYKCSENWEISVPKNDSITEVLSQGKFLWVEIAYICSTEFIFREIYEMPRKTHGKTIGLGRRKSLRKFSNE